jgi:hypothetical protein
LSSGSAALSTFSRDAHVQEQEDQDQETKKKKKKKDKPSSHNNYITTDKRANTTNDELKYLWMRIEIGD